MCEKSEKNIIFTLDVAITPPPLAPTFNFGRVLSCVYMCVCVCWYSVLGIEREGASARKEREKMFGVAGSSFFPVFCLRLRLRLRYVTLAEQNFIRILIFWGCSERGVYALFEWPIVASFTSALHARPYLGDDDDDDRERSFEFVFSFFGGGRFFDAAWTVDRNSNRRESLYLRLLGDR